MLDEKECVACASFNYFTGPGSHVCEACPYPDIMERDVDTYECLCITGYIQSAGSCVKSADITDIISQYPLENARTVVYNFVETNSGLSKVTLQASDTFSHFYIKSLRDCSNTQQIEACQNLANLCVLQLYNEETAICQVYKYIQNTRELASADVPDPGLKENMAWIYYENNAEDVLTADTVNMDVTFDSNHDSKVNLLEFQLAMFRLNGTFIQYESLTDQLLLCPHSDSDSSLYRKLGTNVIYDCDLDLTPYIYYDETIFYDPYLVDQDGTLIDVPVLIENFVDENGDKPNEDSDKAN